MRTELCILYFFLFSFFSFSKDIMVIVFLTYVAGETPISANSVNSARQVDTTSGSVTNRIAQKPFFDDVFARNVTAIVGQPAVLNCRVKHVGDRTVSPFTFKTLSVTPSRSWSSLNQGSPRLASPFLCKLWHSYPLYVAPNITSKRFSKYAKLNNTEPDIIFQLKKYSSHAL